MDVLDINSFCCLTCVFQNHIIVKNAYKIPKDRVQKKVAKVWYFVKHPSPFFLKREALKA